MTRLQTLSAREPDQYPDQCDFWTLRGLWVTLSRNDTGSPEEANRLARVESELDRICAPCCTVDWRQGQEPFLH